LLPRPDRDIAPRMSYPLWQGERMQKQRPSLWLSGENWNIWKERVVTALLFLWWCLVLWACLKVAFWIIGWLRHGFLVLIGME